MLLADVARAAACHEAAVRVTRAKAGRSWPALMEAKGIDFALVSK
jgi:hypothetical protein